MCVCLGSYTAPKVTYTGALQHGQVPCPVDSHAQSPPPAPGTLAGPDTVACICTGADTGAGADTGTDTDTDTGTGKSVCTCKGTCAVLHIAWKLWLHGRLMTASDGRNFS